MKINKKALFFDIDGTLFSEKLRQVPQSAVLALKKTMEKGNLTFINTGRTWCQTSKIREEAPVNGLLCGCGTYISVDGKTLYDQRISPERAEKLKEDIELFRKAADHYEFHRFPARWGADRNDAGDPLDSRPERLGFGEELVGSVLFDQ